MTKALQLNNYFFPVVNIVANTDWTPELASKSLPPLVNCNVQTTKAEDFEDTFEVMLDIDVKSTPENLCQYDIHLTAVGIFLVSGDIPNKDQYITMNGSSILYSSSREFLLNTLSRGPWPPIMLEPLFFGAPKPELKEETAP
jgi:preprotein translocase subunit SecB